MTQPLDIAYVEIKPDLKDFSRDATKQLKTAYTHIEKDADHSAKRVAEAFKGVSSKIAEAITPGKQGGGGGDGGGIASGISDLGSVFSSIGELGQAAFARITSFASELGETLRPVGSLLSGMTGTIGQLAATGPAGIALLVIGFVALAAAVAVAAAAVQALITIVSAAAAAIPGLIAGAAAGFGILAIAVNGVAEAFKEQTSGAKKAGAAGVSNARAVADAQRAVLQAQKDLIRAREDEIKRVRTLGIELNRARVTEARAIDDVKNAQLELEDARKLGSPRAEKEAQLRLDEANATLLEAKDRTKNLSAEKQKADKVGINGSDAVLRAQEALIDAQDRLAASQQKSGAAAAAQASAFNNLSKSAQSFVLALVSAKEQLGPIAKSIQEAFFKNTAPLIQPIVDNIKELQPDIDRVAGSFGKIFQELLKFLGGDKAQAALKSILNGLANFLDAVGPSIGPLLDAFAGLVGQSGEFGDNLGGVVADALTKVADFVKNVDLKKLFEDAKNALKAILPIIKPLVSITIDLFKILVEFGKVALPPLAFTLTVVAAGFKLLSTVVEAFFDFAQPAFDWLAINAPKALKTVVDAIINLPGKISAVGPKLLEAGKKLIAKLFEGIGAASSFAGDFAKKLSNAVISVINNNVLPPINRAIQKIQDGLNGLPFIDGVDLPKIPSIPKLAKGGVTTGHTLAEIGEGGRTEAVLPLQDPRAMQKVGSAIANAGGATGAGGETLIAHIYLGNEHVETRAVKIVKGNNKAIARRVKQVPRMV